MLGFYTRRWTLAAMSTALEALKDKNGNSLPIFIRYFWEFNVNASGGSSANANNNGGCFTTPTPNNAYTDQFKNAWVRIWNDFNLNITPRPTVSMVWNPNVQDSANDDIYIVDPSSYYPGNSYVDWIRFDGYNKQQETSFNPPVWTPIGFDAVFSGTLSAYANSTYGKPIMIGETGSCSEYRSPYGQASYLSSMATILGNAQGNPQSPYSYVKALNYFHAPGSYTDKNTRQACADQLIGSGLTQFTTIANSSLFSPTIAP